ncbi:unnamed protein product [Closterium sp. Yama58-4]|nr:unnamed protein product [Closterium sp. Yama58-4]
MEVLEREGHSGPPLVDHLPIPETEELLLHPPPDFHASHDGPCSPHSVRSPRSPPLQLHSSPPARRARGSRGQYSEISEEDYSEDEDNDAVAVIILVIIFLTSPASVSPTTTTPPSDGSDSLYPSDLDGTGTGSSREPRGYRPLPVDSFKGVDASTLDPSTLPSGGRGGGGGEWGTGAGGNWGGGKPGEDPQEGLYPDAKPGRGGGRWGKAGAGAGAGGGGHLGEEAAEVEDYRDSAGVGREGEVVGEDGKRKRSRLDDEVVTWRGAPWRFDVGDWLSSCNGESGVIKTVEEVYGNKCMQDCNGVGTCHYDTGRCRCRIGYTGADCSHMDAHPCSSPPTSSPGVVAGSLWACAGECDLHSGLCFCGAASLFPLRPVPDPCGFAHDLSAWACAGDCVLHSGLCFCGSGSLFPLRPIPDPCGFAHDLAAAVDRTRKDTEALYANTTHYPGWCNTRPEAVGVGMGGSMAMGGAEPRARCTCDYDGAVGAFCHVPVAAFCVNQCSGHGMCIRGHCQCNEGWFSVDCSVPSQATFADPQLPAWLQPFDQAKSSGGKGDYDEREAPVVDHSLSGYNERRWLKRRQDEEEEGEGEGEAEEDAEGGGYDGEGAAGTGRNAAGGRAGAAGAGGATGGAGGRNEVVKRRPLIYIYDLPPQFNSHLLQGRRGKKECVPRLYDRLNRTAFLPDHIHGMEIALHEALLASKHRTTNAEEADFFFVPVYASCLWLRLTNGGDASGIQLLPHVQGNWAWHVTEMYAAVHRHIMHAYPHWNRSRGRDHLWPMGTDEGACLAPQSIWHGSMLTSWGNSMAAHSHSVKAAPQQRWDDIPLTLRGGHLCYSAAKDIVLPAWLPPNVKHLHEQYWLRSFEEREHLFYFAGDLGSEYKGGSPDSRFSFGIRQAVAREFASVPNNKGQLGSQQEEGVIVTNERGKGHSAQLGNARFCGVFPSNGFNADMEEAIKHGCIPVIIQDGIHLPFENALDYASFSVRIEERDILNMLTKLKAITAEHGSVLQGTVQKVWQRLSYHSVIAQEAKRQQDEYGHNEAWAFGISLLKDDDAIDTLIEVLHYKLHNDRWRRVFNYKQSRDELEKYFGVPKSCLVLREYSTGDIMANAAPLNPSAAAMAAAQAIVALRKVSKAAANANLKVPENAATYEARACEVELSHFRGMDERELNLTLHVTSLTRAITREQLLQLFSFCGTVTRCDYLNDDRSVAHIRFSTPGEAKVALDMNNMEIADVKLKVELAKTAQERIQTALTASANAISNFLPGHEGRATAALQEIVAKPMLQFQEALAMQQNATRKPSGACPPSAAAALAMQRAKEISKVLTSKASLDDTLQKRRYENVNTDDRRKPDTQPRHRLSFRDRSGGSDFGTSQSRRKGCGRSENFFAQDSKKTSYIGSKRRHHWADSYDCKHEDKRTFLQRNPSSPESNQDRWQMAQGRTLHTHAFGAEE